MGLSISEYARRRGVSHVAVIAALRAGRIEREPDGTIDPERADQMWDRRTDHTRRPHSPRRRKVLVPADDGPDTQASNAPATLQALLAAKLQNEVLRAKDRRVRLEKLKGTLVNREKAQALLFRLAREERDAWVNWPSRVAAVIAQDLAAIVEDNGTLDPAQVQRVLERHVRAHLEELADVSADFDAR